MCRYLHPYGIAGAWLLAVALLSLPALAAAPGAHVDEGRHFDARLAPASLQATAEPARLQLEGIERLRSERPDLLVTFDPLSGATRSLFNATGFLSDELAGDPFDASLVFLQESLEILGLTSADLEEHVLLDRVESPISGATHLYLQQEHLGIPVYLGLLQVNVGRTGRILSVNNSWVPGLIDQVDALTPELDAAAAVAAAARHLEVRLEGEPRVQSLDRDPRQTSLVEVRGLSQEPIEARLAWLPVAAGDTRLVWNFQIYTLDEQHAFDFTVDAGTGEVWTRFDWVASDSYQVYQQPVESPNHAAILPPADGRTVVVDPADPTASPFGWHDTNGVAGAEFTTMRGNNVHAYDDANANGLPPAVEPDCGATLDCLFPINLAAAPGTYTSAAVANLFYWNNLIHDIQYQYGFDEASGNFQVNNYGNPGLAGDDVRAEAQDGGGLNNANFLTPPDGSRPRMQMFLWNLTSPMRDGDLENSIIVHEYGHGISNRLVGGPSSVSCLNNLQQPGEGLSDWWALAYTATAAQTGPTPRGIGTYVLGQPTNGPGIRVLPYSTNNAVNNWTYSSVAGMSVPHGVGSVWAQGAWEVYWGLVNAHGFSTNLGNALGGAGNQRMMLYVNEGLKNTICRPAFTDVRDGIVQAAINNYNGEDVCRVWRSFAAFGLGTDAVSGGPNSLAPTDGFQVPGSCQLNPQTIQAAPTTSNVSGVVCPAGTRVAGGGCLDGTLTTNLHSAFPLYPATFGIEAFACIHDATVANLTSFAICVNDPGTVGFNQIQQNVAAGGGIVAVALCPAGQTAIGGGCSDDTFNSALLNSSLPLSTSIFGTEGWACIFDSNPGGITAYATCIDSNQVAGLQVVQQSTSVGQSVAASCPAGNLSLGGGCLDSSLASNLQDPLPLSPFGIEAFGCIWNAPATTSLTAYSLCLAP